MSNSIQIILVENSENEAAGILEELNRGGYEPMFEQVQTAKELIQALNRHPWDIVISEYVMPQFSAPEALKMVREKDRDLPFIVISGVYGEDTAVRMMKTGATDYFVKNNLTRLATAIKREMKAMPARRARTRAETTSQSFAEIVEASDDAIYSIKPDGTVASWNQAAERIYGFRAGEIIGRNVSILYPDEHTNELIETMERIRHGEHLGRFETVRVRKSGRQIPISVSISPITNAEDEITGAAVIAHDISWRKQKEFERTKLIEDLTEALSHAKMLAGLLPICAHCKRIRDEQGDWQQIEAYISRHSGVEFTHGICPSCYKQATAEIGRHEPRAAVG